MEQAVTGSQPFTCSLHSGRTRHKEVALGLGGIDASALPHRADVLEEIAMLWSATRKHGQSKRVRMHAAYGSL